MTNTAIYSHGKNEGKGATCDIIWACSALSGQFGGDGNSQSTEPLKKGMRSIFIRQTYESYLLLSQPRLLILSRTSFWVPISLINY